MTAASRIPSPSSPTARPGLQEQQRGEDLLVYDHESRLVHVLNGTATAIFRMCDGRHDLEAIERSIRLQYHVSEVQDVRKDITETLELLREKKLLL